MVQLRRIAETARALPQMRERALAVLNGGHTWVRTKDLPIKSRLLYQLSYMPRAKNPGLRSGAGIFGVPYRI